MILKWIQPDLFEMLLNIRIRSVKSGNDNIRRCLNNGICTSKEMNLTIVAIAGSQLLARNGKFTIVAISDKNRTLGRSDKDLGILNIITLDFCNMIQYQCGTIFQLVDIERITVDNLFVVFVLSSGTRVRDSLDGV